MANILLTSLGSAGDVLPFVRLGSTLQNRGHAVTLLTHCVYQKHATEAGLDFATLDSPEEYARFIEDGPLLNAPRGIAEFMRRHVLPKVLLEYELIQQRGRSDDTILITRDMFDLAARLSMETLGIPVRWVFMAPSQLTTWPIRLQLFRDVLAADINRLRAEMGLVPVDDWHSWLGYPRGNLALWPDWFAPPDSSWPAEVVSAGFLQDNEEETDDVPEALQKIITSGAPPILITGGSGMYLGIEFYTASVEACRLLNRRGILVTRYEQQVPQSLPVLVERFITLPFGKLMPQIGAVIHHGGRGTLSCAIAAGKPQLVMAMGADRPDNAMRLQHLGVATYIPPPLWQPRIIAEHLHQLLTSQSILEHCHVLADRVRNTNTTRIACETIEAALLHEATDARPPQATPTGNRADSVPTRHSYPSQQIPLLSQLTNALPADRHELLALLLRKNRQTGSEFSHDRSQRREPNE